MIESLFSSNKFREVKEAFVDKYGKPSDDSSKVLQNPFGATYKQERFFWRGKQMKISLYKFSDSDSSYGGGPNYNLDQSAVYIVSNAPYQVFVEEKKNPLD